MSMLKQDMSMLKQDMSMLKQDMPILKQDMPMLKQDMPMLKQDMSMLKQDMPMLKQDMSMLKILPSLDDLLNDGETLLSWFEKQLIETSTKPGHYQICKLGISYLNELFKITQSRYTIIGQLYNNIFQFYPPLSGIILWMAQPDIIL